MLIIIKRAISVADSIGVLFGIQVVKIEDMEFTFELESVIRRQHVVVLFSL